MITVRAGSAAIGLCLVLLASGCSREQQDWRSAEAADTIDSYGQFIQRHPESELVTQARTRVAQLGEDRDWQRAGSADTVDAYREFISQHPNGKWAQEANIRIQNFSLGEQTGTDAASKVTGTAGSSSGGTRVASSGSSAAASAGAGLAVGGPRAAPAVPGSAVPGSASGASGGAGSAVRGAASSASSGAGSAVPGAASSASSGAGSAVPGSAGSASSGAGSAKPTSGSQGTGARSYGLAQPGDAAAPPRTVGPPASSAAVAAAARPGSSVGSAPSPSGSANTALGVHGPSAPQQAGVSAKGGFGIQLGAFSSEASASTQWRTLSAKYASQLQGLQQHVVPADTASGRIYRLQAAVGNEDRARAICVQLKTYGQACVAVLPH